MGCFGTCRTAPNSRESTDGSHTHTAKDASALNIIYPALPRSMTSAYGKCQPLDTKTRIQLSTHPHQPGEETMVRGEREVADSMVSFYGYSVTSPACEIG